MSGASSPGSCPPGRSDRTASRTAPTTVPPRPACCFGSGGVAGGGAGGRGGTPAGGRLATGAPSAPTRSLMWREMDEMEGKSNTCAQGTQPRTAGPPLGPSPFPTTPAQLPHWVSTAWHCGSLPEYGSTQADRQGGQTGPPARQLRARGWAAGAGPVPTRAPPRAALQTCSSGLWRAGGAGEAGNVSPTSFQRVGAAGSAHLLGVIQLKCLPLRLVSGHKSRPQPMAICVKSLWIEEAGRLRLGG
jgi:hypothetical protein